MKSALEAANEAWDSAPVHIKMMAGAYVSPILAALADQQRQINELALRVAYQGGEHGKP